jgi:hypothetical protein
MLQVRNAMDAKQQRVAFQRVDLELTVFNHCFGQWQFERERSRHMRSENAHRDTVHTLNAVLSELRDLAG